MIDFKDIFKSWVISLNPSEKELKRADARFDICLQCEFKREIIKNKKWTLYCGACGCALKKKVYSNVINPCPKSKWIEVDKLYDSFPLEKNGQTLL